ncbi:hypothetical protein SADUNF_Sadunf13G0116400 [Salix dunnii]|uniref:Uncharacterized protein n=1 Tax=Salix dunnii TaxID=1413687 RepID=A0A835JGP8_9ROSI|nr:hypothetical protein SADUNF_Sadunf13G0116400 [Salix dunnii]
MEAHFTVLSASAQNKLAVDVTDLSMFGGKNCRARPENEERSESNMEDAQNFQMSIVGLAPLTMYELSRRNGKTCVLPLVWSMEVVEIGKGAAWIRDYAKLVMQMNL